MNKEADVQRCSVKKVFLEVWQHSQENTCARIEACNFINKETPFLNDTHKEKLVLY